MRNDRRSLFHRQAGEMHLAEVERIIRLYLSAKDDLEPVPAKEMLDRTRKGAVTVLDVRPPEEFAAGHLPGAVNIPIPRTGEAPQRVAEAKGSRRLLPSAALLDVVRRGRAAAKEGCEGTAAGSGATGGRSAGLPIERE